MFRRSKRQPPNPYANRPLEIRYLKDPVLNNSRVVSGLVILIVGGLLVGAIVGALQDPRTEQEKIMADHIDRIDKTIESIYADVSVSTDEVILICTNWDVWAEWINGVIEYENRERNKPRAHLKPGSSEWMLADPGVRKHMRDTFNKALKHSEFIRTAERTCRDW